jgi:CheY-like chemotaxis protein
MNKPGGIALCTSARDESAQRPLFLAGSEINPAASDSPGKNSMTILVVEDEYALRLPVVKILRREGFCVLAAADGQAAVELFQARHREIGVVLLDVTLPYLSGAEVLEQMRRVQPDVRVILTSAYSQETVAKTIGDQPFWAYVRKPYSSRNLAVMLRTAYQRQGE